MAQNFASQQPSLFELFEETPRITVAPSLKFELATLVESLLSEIAATIAKEVGDEQDHQ